MCVSVCVAGLVDIIVFVCLFRYEKQSISCHNIRKDIGTMLQLPSPSTPSLFLYSARLKAKNLMYINQLLYTLNTLSRFMQLPSAVTTGGKPHPPTTDGNLYSCQMMRDY